MAKLKYTPTITTTFILEITPEEAEAIYELCSKYDPKYTADALLFHGPGSTKANPKEKYRKPIESLIKGIGDVWYHYRNNLDKAQLALNGVKQ